MDVDQAFLTPQNSNHRQYEALRAYFVERLPGPEVARRFGYTLGSLHQLVHQFRRNPQRQFFAEPSRPGAKRDNAVRQQIIQLRKQNLSIDDISDALKKEDIRRSPVAVGVRFITLRRRGSKLMQELAAQPRSTWRRIELEGVSRIYKTPRILDRRITLTDYHEPIRQIAVTDLGHEEPTLLLTNQLRRSAAKLIERYARRMLIENNIENGVNFFHMDALSSAVALKVNCDVQLTLMASSLYRHLGQRIGNGYDTAKSRQLFLDFIDATATILLGQRTVVVRFQKRAHNPLLVAAGFDATDIRIPWLGNRRLQFQFG